MALNRQMLKKSLTVARREMSSLNVVVSSVQLAELKKESNKKVLYFVSELFVLLIADWLLYCYLLYQNISA